MGSEGTLPAVRALVIGLDAFDKDLAAEWTASGDLPVLARLLSEGTVVTIRNPPGLQAGCAWPSFATSLSPARHRRFFRLQARRGEYLQQDFDPEATQGAHFWELLGAAGRSACVVDVPHARVSRDVRGIHLVDWTTHEPDFAPARSHPAELVADLERRFGRPVPDACDHVERTAAGFEGFLGRLERRIDDKLALASHLFATDDFDLRVVVFGEAHCAGHQCFHLHDPRHPQHDAAMRARIGDPMQRLYRKLDAAIGELLAGAGEDTAVLVLLSHGMKAYYSAEDAIFDDILRRIDGHDKPGPTHRRGAAYGALKRLWHRLPGAVRNSRFARRLRSTLAPGLHHGALVPDRKSRRFFAIPNNPHSGAVRINLVGREAHGVVEARDYDAVCAGLRDALFTLRCADTGAPYVRAVVRARDLYSGPYLDELPDLLVDWNRDAPIKAVSSPATGTLEVPLVVARTGDHSNEGLLVARGRGFAARREPRAVDIADLGPTIAALFGVTLDGVDGRVAPELIPGRG